MKLNNDMAAVVTGGASGLGAAVVEALAEAGVEVTIFDMNAEAGTAKAKAVGGHFQQIDVSDPAAVAEGFAAVEARGKALRVVQNCAGIGPAAKTVSRGEPHDPALFAKVIGVNLIGSFNCSSYGAALMAKADPVNDDGARGVIISTASVAAYEGQIGQVAYAASKGGVVGMTLPMARDLSQLGIRVCTIAPGLFLTPLLQGLPQDVQDSLGQQVPFPSRLGQPAEYAALSKHIAENDMLNGEVIRLDGAIRMAPR
ncbi:SDR family NAD(P)-dependent oxidoreductase [Aliiroseovarius sp. PTFE2010]|uniref:SDR family NAD(P)-dependent oxidoreductase n=1 Tax=Aliiroseovarius sp. PTFE2010 TaxID=3417190 RepID=UPI003CF90219